VFQLPYSVFTDTVLRRDVVTTGHKQEVILVYSTSITI